MNKIVFVLVLIFISKSNIINAQSYQQFNNKFQKNEDSQSRIHERGDSGNIFVRPLDINITSQDADEFGIAFTYDCNHLFFISDRKGSIINPETHEESDDIWVVHKQRSNNGLFSIPSNIDYSDKPEYINTNSIYNEANLCFTHDSSNTCYISLNDRPNGIGSMDMFVSMLKDSEFRKPYNLGAPINSEYWEAHPALSKDNQRLIFASNRPGPNSKGDMEVEEVDLWYSTWNSDFEMWDPPKNIVGINTDGCDWSPFMAFDGKTLFFASDSREPSIGGLDIYITRFDEETQSWSIPILLPEPINSPADEGFVAIPVDGSGFYFSSTRLDPKEEKYSLFEAKLDDVLFLNFSKK